jgi:hypothetical protein
MREVGIHSATDLYVRYREEHCGNKGRSLGQGGMLMPALLELGEDQGGLGVAKEPGF